MIYKLQETKPLFLLWAGICWTLAGVLYLGSEAIAASAYPGYSYVMNYISDLGVPYYGTYNGRVQNSQLAEVMNIGGFILNGLVFSLAALLLYLSRKTKSALVLLVLAVIHTVGNILVGTIHGGPQEAVSGTGIFHVIGALFAIVAGNLVVLTAGKLSYEYGAPDVYRNACYVLGTIGLVSFGLLGLNIFMNEAVFLPYAVHERMAVYTITLWECMTGLYIFVLHYKYIRQ